MSYDDDKQAWDDFWKGRGATIAAVIIGLVVLASLWSMASDII